MQRLTTEQNRSLGLASSEIAPISPRQLLLAAFVPGELRLSFAQLWQVIQTNGHARQLLLAAAVGFSPLEKQVFDLELSTDENGHHYSNQQILTLIGKSEKDVILARKLALIKLRRQLQKS